ncbi:hypothetical protein D3C78_793680 [compost metagenome]
MQAMPTTTSSSGTARRLSGTAPASRRPSRVTVTGTTPTISAAVATPASWMALASSR